MKKLIALLLSGSLLLGAAYTSVYAAKLYTASSTTSSDGETVEDATEAPADDYAAETETPTMVPSEDEDYSGAENPEDGDMEIGGADSSNSGALGAAGGLGFLGSKFPDCRGHWAEDIIAQCTDNKFLDGYDDGNFYPDNPVTASEFAKIFSAWRGSFYQITSGYWAIPYIINMLDDGIFEKDDYSDYDTPMTREQVAKAVVNSLKNENFPVSIERYRALIPDIDEADNEFCDYLVKAYMSGIMSGYDDGTIQPKDNVTRAEVLSIIDRTVDPAARVVPDAVLELQASSDMSDEASRTVRILAESATVEGGMLNKIGTGADSYIENFRTEQKITFNFKADLEGKYKMTIYYSANVNSGGGTVTFNLNGKAFDHEFAQTGGWAYYVYEYLGEVELDAGDNTLILTDKEIPNTYLINVKNIEFEKID